MRVAKFLKLVVILTLFGNAQYSLAKSLVAKKDGVKVYAEGSKKSKVVATLAKGDEMESTERKGMYWQVDYKGKKGFVSVMKVKKKAGQSSGGIAEALRDAVKQGRDESDATNSRQRSAVMGVRGLDESSETEFAGNVKPNLRMVYNMEGFLVKQTDVDAIGDLVASEIEKKIGQ
mgnify:CR=1 FL=1